MYLNKIVIFIFLCVTNILLYKIYSINNLTNSYIKMYKIIETKGKLDKDLYKRKISSKVIKKFCKIAKKYSINLDTISDLQFDFIYRKSVSKLLKKHNKS